MTLILTSVPVTKIKRSARPITNTSHIMFESYGVKSCWHDTVLFNLLEGILIMFRYNINISLFLLQLCTDPSWSIVLWLKRRWRLYDGYIPNLQRRQASSPLSVRHDSFGMGRALLTLADVFIYYIFDILFLSPNMFVNNFNGLSALVGCWYWVFIRRIIYNFFNSCPFDYTAFALSGKVGILLTGLTTLVR